MIRSWLSDVVIACPNELAHGKLHISVLANAGLNAVSAPAGSAVSKRRALLIAVTENRNCEREMINAPALNNGIGLTSIDDPVRMLLVMLLIIILSVVVTCNLEDIRTFLRHLPRHIVRANCDSCIHKRIMQLNIGFEVPRYFLTSLACMSIVYLISDAPHDHRWMISVSSNPAGNISLVPLGEKSCVVKLSLWPFPHIKGL